MLHVELSSYQWFLGGGGVISGMHNIAPKEGFVYQPGCSLTFLFYSELHFSQFVHYSMQVHLVYTG